MAFSGNEKSFNIYTEWNMLIGWQEIFPALIAARPWWWSAQQSEWLRRQVNVVQGTTNIIDFLMAVSSPLSPLSLVQATHRPLSSPKSIIMWTRHSSAGVVLEERLSRTFFETDKDVKNSLRPEIADIATQCCKYTGDEFCYPSVQQSLSVRISLVIQKISIDSLMVSPREFPERFSRQQKN